MTFYGDLGHCPKCGKFCGGIQGRLNRMGLHGVTGACKTHGKVDLSHQSWSYDHFENEGK